MGGAHAMSMAWAPGPGQPWLAAAAALLIWAATFVVGWTAMMGAMMLPSLVPMLRRYRRAVRAARACVPLDGRQLATLTAIVAAGYLAVWCAAGVGLVPLIVAAGAAAARWSLLARSAPVIAAALVVGAGVLQLSRWKSRRLDCCREARERRQLRPVGARTAWRHGLRLGVDCVQSCAPLTAMLLAVGMMDLRVMAAVTGAITAERLAPGGQRVARAVGVVGVAVGLLLVARAVAMR